MCDREDALLAAIAAAPTDHLVRGVYADWLDEAGRHDEADAVRATADRVPMDVIEKPDPRRWAWAYGGKPDDAMGRLQMTFTDSIGLTCGVPEPYFSRLTGFTLGKGRLPRYATITVALLDLIRAWCAVHRSEVPA